MSCCKKLNDKFFTLEQSIVRTESALSKFLDKYDVVHGKLRYSVVRSSATATAQSAGARCSIARSREERAHFHRLRHAAPTVVNVLVALYSRQHLETTDPY